MLRPIMKWALWAGLAVALAGTAACGTLPMTNSSTPEPVVGQG